MSYQYWTNEERERLLKAVRESLAEHNGQRINWEVIAARIPTRTREQCKSYYTNILKKKTGIESLRYYVWSREDVELLCRVAPEMKYNWKLIRDQHFPRMTPAQISGKYHYYLKQDGQTSRRAKAETDSYSTDSAPPSMNEIGQLADAIIGLIMAE